jgi:hypothetical protein
MINKLLEDIAGGLYDDNLMTIMQALDARKSAKDSTNITSQNFRIGSVVMFNSRVNPKYLFGRKARIVKINRVKVKILLNEDCGRFSSKRPINCPRDILSIV